jgi:hypothetical protein
MLLGLCGRDQATIGTLTPLHQAVHCKVNRYRVNLPGKMPQRRKNNQGNPKSRRDDYVERELFSSESWIPRWNDTLPRDSKSEKRTPGRPKDAVVYQVTGNSERRGCPFFAEKERRVFDFFYGNSS